jgi:hypothetical protein
MPPLVPFQVGIPHSGLIAGARASRSADGRLWATEDPVLATSAGRPAVEASENYDPESVIRSPCWPICAICILLDTEEPYMASAP